MANRVYGENGSAIYTIIMNWSLICVNLVMGVALAAQPLIGFAYGRGRLNHVRDYRRYVLTGSMLLGVLFLIVGCSMTGTLVSVFAKDNRAVIQNAYEGLRLYLPAYLLMGAGICIGYYFQSIAYSRQSMLIQVMRGTLLPCLHVVTLSSLSGKTGLWIAMLLAEGITSLTAVILMTKSPPYFSEKPLLEIADSH